MTPGGSVTSGRWCAETFAKTDWERRLRGGERRTQPRESDPARLEPCQSRRTANYDAVVSEVETVENTPLIAFLTVPIAAMEPMEISAARSEYSIRSWPFSSRTKRANRFITTLHVRVCLNWHRTDRSEVPWCRQARRRGCRARSVIRVARGRLYCSGRTNSQLLRCGHATHLNSVTCRG